MQSYFNRTTLLLNKECAKTTIFMNGSKPLPMREHTNMLKVVGFIQNDMGVSLQHNAMFEFMTTYKTEKDLICGYRNNYDRDGEFYNVAHSLSKLKWGRTLPANYQSLSIMCRPTRHAFCQGIYADKDMVNAHVSIICEIFKDKPEFDISALIEYNADPKRWRRDVAIHHGLDPVKNMDNAKELFIRVLFGGSYETWIKDFDINTNIKPAQQHPLVLKIETQLNAIREAFYESNPQMAKDLKKHNPAKYCDVRQLKRSLLSFALQTIERWLMEACVSFLVYEKGFDIKDIVPCQDGLMVLKSLDYPDMEKDFERVCCEQFQLGIKWVDKPFNEAISIPDGIISRTLTQWFELMTDDGISQEILQEYGGKIRYKRPEEDTASLLYVFNLDKHRWFLEDEKNPITLLNIVSKYYDKIKNEIDNDDSLTDKEEKLVASKSMSLLRNCSGQFGICKRIIQQAEWCNGGFDTIPYYLGFENGFLDLRTHQFEDYREDIYISITTGYDYKIPDFDNNPRDIEIREEIVSMVEGLFDKPDMIYYFLQILASGLDGINHQHFWLFEGEGGNGKSMGLGLNECVLGGRMYSTPDASILEADSKKANQSSEDVILLKNKRTAVFNEMGKNEGMTWDALKALTGGDPITARRLYKGTESFRLSGSFIGTFNGKLNFVGDVSESVKNSLERRIRPVKFPFIFTDDADKLALGGRYKTKESRFVEPEWRVEVRHVWLDLLCGIYMNSYDTDKKHFVFKEPDSVLHACREFIKNEDLFDEVFTQLYFKQTGDIVDTPNKRVFIGNVYDEITFSQQYRDGANGKGKKTFVRCWNKKAFISWCENRFDVRTCPHSYKQYIIGFKSKASCGYTSSVVENTDCESIEYIEEE